MKNKKRRQWIIDDYVYVNPFEGLERERSVEEIQREYEEVLERGNRKEIDEFVSENFGFGIEEC